MLLFRKSETIDLDAACRLHVMQVMDDAAARACMRHLLLEVPLEARSIVLFGRTVLQPRLIGWGGEVPYTYSRQTLPPRPLGPELRQLLELTLQLVRQPFNHALLNYYRSGLDSMGMHSDDEPELGQNPLIASWSFGAERRFVLAEKRGKRRLDMRLGSGCLLLMEGATQHRFRHGLPKDPRIREARLNVTFRNIQT